MSTLDLRSVLDRVPSLMAYWDSDLRCRFANRAYRTWFKLDAEQILGTRLPDLVGPELFAVIEDDVREALKGQTQVFERLVEGADGKSRRFLASYIPDIVDGEVRGFLAHSTEETELQQAQAALERERGLRNQFEQQAEHLRELLRERSEMLDVLAHEVRQPLNNASAALQSAAAILANVGDTSAAARMSRAQVVIGEVTAGVDNTLAVASLLARPNPICRTDCDVDTLIAVAIGDMPAAERCRIRVERATATRTASMDMSLMRLALRNLLSNGLKYSPAGSAVEVRVTDSDEPLALIIDVSDTGKGVDPQVLPRLFERGTRGSDVRSEGSHGLGLYIVRRVMELHDSTVVLHRNSHAGTTMRLVVEQTTGA
jgi:PAS domain S-box-containing protein